MCGAGQKKEGKKRKGSRELHTTTATTLGGQDFSPEFGEFGLEDTDVEGRRLVLLSAIHLHDKQRSKHED
jgi:hypothetical protein